MLYSLKITHLVSAFVFFLFPINKHFSQTNPTPNKEFNHYWIMEEYYNHLQTDTTLFDAFDNSYSDKSKYPIRIIYISLQDSIINLSTLNEGFNESFIIKNHEEIYIDKSLWYHNPYTLSLKQLNGTSKLVLTELNNKESAPIYYIPLDDKYYHRGGFTNYINDKFITGTYLANNKSKVKFYSDEKLEGLKGYNKYVLVPFGFGIFKNQIAFKFFDEIVRTLKLCYWHKEGKDILFYSLSDESPDAKIVGVYMKLKFVE